MPYRRDKRMHRICILRSLIATDNPAPLEVLRQLGANFRQSMQTVFQRHCLFGPEPVLLEEQGYFVGVDFEDSRYQE
jgi:hypothetical protein